MTREHWIPAPGFPGYQVSTRGRVRNASTGRVLHHATKLYPSTRYPAANLPSGGKFRSVRTHILICEAFWGPRPPGHEAAHVNGDRSDTRPANLEWQTVGQNRRDAAAAQRAELGRVRRGWSKRRRRRRPINAGIGIELKPTYFRQQVQNVAAALKDFQTSDDGQWLLQWDDNGDEPEDVETLGDVP